MLHSMQWRHCRYEWANYNKKYTIGQKWSLYTQFGMFCFSQWKLIRVATMCVRWVFCLYSAIPRTYFNDTIICIKCIFRNEHHGCCISVVLLSFFFWSSHSLSYVVVLNIVVVKHSCINPKTVDRSAQTKQITTLHLHAPACTTESNLRYNLRYDHEWLKSDFKPDTPSISWSLFTLFSMFRVRRFFSSVFRCYFFYLPFLTLSCLCRIFPSSILNWINNMQINAKKEKMKNYLANGRSSNETDQM